MIGDSNDKTNIHINYYQCIDMFQVIGKLFVNK